VVYLFTEKTKKQEKAKKLKRNGKKASSLSISTHKLGVEEKDKEMRENHKRNTTNLLPFLFFATDSPHHSQSNKQKKKNTKRNQQTAEQEEAQIFHLSLYTNRNTYIHTYIYIHT
jgi:hypothetical protein